MKHSGSKSNPQIYAEHDEDARMMANFEVQAKKP